MVVNALIFDLFGVLLTDKFSEVVADTRKGDPEKADRIARLDDLVGTLDDLEESQMVAHELGIASDEYARMIHRGELRNTALLTYIEALRPRYKVALLSNISRGGLASRFSEGELTRYFDVAIASGDIGVAKPAPQAYMQTAEALGVPTDECLLVDDQAAYCRGAEAVGMQSIHYTTFAHMKRELSKYSTI